MAQTPSGLIWACRITGFQRACSDLMKASNSAPVLPTARAVSWANLSLTRLPRTALVASTSGLAIFALGHGFCARQAGGQSGTRPQPITAVELFGHLGSRLFGSKTFRARRRYRGANYGSSGSEPRDRQPQQVGPVLQQIQPCTSDKGVRPPRFEHFVKLRRYKLHQLDPNLTVSGARAGTGRWTGHSFC